MADTTLALPIRNHCAGKSKCGTLVDATGAALMQGYVGTTMEQMDEIVRLVNRPEQATPPADAALADAMKEVEHTLWQNGFTRSAETVRSAAARLRTLSQPGVAQVPEGFVLVPIEPTEAMIIAGDGWSITKRGELRTVYRAMLSAAPSAKGGEG